MRIAEIAPMYEAVPPAGYGGTERVVGALCDELVRAGHDVTLFASGGSATAARLVTTTPEPLRTRFTHDEMVDVAPQMHRDMLASVYEHSDQFDLVHAHTEWATLPFAASSSTPTLVTLHGRQDLEEARRAFQSFPNVPLVSISDHQREAVRDLPLRWAATIPNGLDLSRYFTEPRTDGRYLAFLGRIAPEKRPDLAVAVAARTGRRLRVAAKVDPLDVDYFNRIEPLFGRHRAEFLGELGEHEKPAFFAGAEATVFSSDWPEPFGLVMIESLAAGTPVIALRRGSVPEVIVDGVSGFVCDDLDGMVRAVSRLDDIDPEDCRREARRFTAVRMSARYCDVMTRIVERARASYRRRPLAHRSSGSPMPDSERGRTA